MQLLGVYDEYLAAPLAQVLISLGVKELEEIAAEGKTFPVECQFCDTVYQFTPENIRELIAKSQ